MPRLSVVAEIQGSDSHWRDYQANLVLDSRLLPGKNLLGRYVNSIGPNDDTKTVRAKVGKEALLP